MYNSTQIKIYSMNILAPCWINQKNYPGINLNIMSTDLRRQRIFEFLYNNEQSADIFLFQETQVSENKWLSDILEKYFYYFYVYHDDTYWSSWTLDSNIYPFERNGVAIAISKSKYDSISTIDFGLGTGGHSAIIICRNKILNKFMRIASVHLDPDNKGRWNKEIETLKHWFGDNNYYIDIIGGDFNEEIVNIKGFTNILSNTDKTFPYSVIYTTNNGGLKCESKVGGSIDHILIRGHNVKVVGCKIYDADLWNTYPILHSKNLPLEDSRLPINSTNGDENDILRMRDNILIYGSDHFFISGTIKIL